MTRHDASLPSRSGVDESRDAAPPPSGESARGLTFESRSLLVARLARQLSHDAAPRLHLSIILVLSGGAAFLSSVLLLWSGSAVFENMALRYGMAALSGYLAFLLLIRLWIRLHRPVIEDDGFHPLDALDIPSLPAGRLPRGAGDGFGGGRSGGGGSSATWGSTDASSYAGRSGGSSGGWNVDLDPDDAVWLALLACCAIAGGVVIVYVIYIAPVLLAEVALDAAIVSALYRRLRRDEAGYWLTTAISRTWIPALIMVVFMIGAGFALTRIAPEARSIGGVIAALAK